MTGGLDDAGADRDARRPEVLADVRGMRADLGARRPGKRVRPAGVPAGRMVPVARAIRAAGHHPATAERNAPSNAGRRRRNAARALDRILDERKRA